jgi:hypothetical protein
MNLKANTEKMNEIERKMKNEYMIIERENEQMKNREKHKRVRKKSKEKKMKAGKAEDM